MIEKFDPRNIKSTQREAIINIEKYANEGVAIGYDNEKIVFVRYAIPGEKIRVNVYRETKDYAVAEPLEIINPSPLRQTPLCEYFGMCGGCDYQMFDYKTELDVKKSLVVETFSKIGKLDISNLIETLPSPKEYYYRNNETFKVYAKKQKAGFFRKDTKSIIDIGSCKIAMDGINKALDTAKKNDPFPEHNFKVRTTMENDTVINWVKVDNYEDRDVFETVRSSGQEIKFKISKDSFFQVNDYMIPLWLDKIISFLDKNKTERIADLYCGIGLITLFVSHYAKETLGIEISKSSIDDANFNKNLNSISSNVNFILGDVEEKVNELGFFDVVIVDPPRKGMDENTLNFLLKIEPAKIIYSSCKPATMARDINILSEKYKLTKAFMVDMFPQTHHVEMLCLLEKK